MRKATWSTKEIKFPQRIGRCIYCGHKGPGLTREHVVPLGLNGEWTLLDASCTTCAKETSAFEGNTLGRVFIAPRLGLGMRSRDKRRHRTRLPVVVEIDGERRQVDLPVGQAPIFALTPIFKPPGCLLPEYAGGISVMGLQVTHLGPPDIRDVAKALGVKKFTVQLRYRPASFARMIAKIAYAFAVAGVGLNGLEDPYVVPSIRGTVDEVGRWVGSLTDDPWNAGNYLHAVTLRVIEPDLHARVRLFTQYRFPEYHVVVGRLSKIGLAALRKPKHEA
jgi:hypothetical protein